jgi:UDP-N-acetylmuramoyl-L-alanyl-D-glutamate--2,6-diaminopimelate ligase
VDYDSRRVQRGSLFVAVEGYQTDGHRFIGAAYAAGAAAAAGRRLPAEAAGKPFLVVPDPRRALAVCAGAVAGHPDRTLALTGITGTNGKTTTAYLLSEVLARAQGRAGLISTVETKIASRQNDALLRLFSLRTTPEAPDLYPLLLEMHEQGCRSVVMEVSSHALELQRVYGMKFAAVAFTNLTQDHLDFHGDVESYFRAKARLFLEYDRGTAVINADDPYGARLLQMIRRPALSYSLADAGDVRALTLELNAQGMRMTAQTPRGAVEIQSPITGRFNAYNLLCALGICEALNLPLDCFVEAARTFRGAPGRMERFDYRNRWIYVDYAHTPDALEKVLRELKAFLPGPLTVLFGCGGNRDRGKRPLMGAIAERLADRVFITSDNPRDEDPAVIADEILAGCENPERAVRILDRREAIRTALEELPENSALLIAGKGHEPYQEIRGVRHPFDDREEVRRFIAAKGRTRGAEEA